MATSLAAQLAQIAVNSKISLDVKAQKAAHSKSLLFEPRVAAAQSIPSLFAVCRDGFDELCQLDERFEPFGHTLFSALSQDEDRTQMSEAENGELDKKIESFLRLCGGKLRLLPAIKAVEWLIRRFRIHEFNTTAVITTFLPYHSIPAFVTLMSILPARLPHEYRFLSPYVRSLTAPPRAAIVQHATHHFELLQTLSAYTLAACRSQQQYPGLLSFWGGVFTEAVNGMLDAGRSGRRSVQVERDQALLQQVGPILGEALVAKQAPGLQVAAYMALAVFGSKADLSDTALSAFMEQLVHGWGAESGSGETAETTEPGLVCLAILAQRRSAKQLSRRVAKAVLKVPDLAARLVKIGQRQRIDKLANGLVLALTGRLAKKAASAERSLPIIRAILLGGVLPERQLAVAFKALLLAAHGVTDETDPSGTARRALGSTLVVLSQATSESGGDVMRRVLEEADFDIEELELRLDASIRPKLLAAPTEMAVDGPSSAADADADAQTQPQRETLEAGLARLAQMSRPTSCLCGGDSDALFGQLAQLLLETAAYDKDSLDRLDAAPLLGRASAVSDPFYLSFCIRVWCGAYPTLARATALDMAAKRLADADCADVDFQAVLPYCIAALGDPAKKVRRAAGRLWAELAAAEGQHENKENTEKKKVDKKGRHEHEKRWGANLYKVDDINDLKWLTADAQAALLGVVAGSLEETALHDSHLSTVLRDALDKSHRSEDAAAAMATATATATPTARLSHNVRLAILAFLAGHTVHTPLLAVKVRLLDTLDEVRGVSGTSRTQLLLPVLTWWASLAESEARQRVDGEAVAGGEEAVDRHCVGVVVPNDKAGLEALFGIVQKKPSATGQPRPGLVRAVFARIRKMWPVMKEDFRSATAQFLMEQALGGEEKNEEGETSETSEEAADVLQHVELSSRILAGFLQSLPSSSAVLEQAAPPSKRRRTSLSEHGHGAGEVAVATTGIGAGELKAILHRTTFVLQLVQGADPAAHPELLPALFVVLSDLQTLRTAVGSELGYLQSVVLSCLLAMMPAYQSNRSLKIDTSVGHGDVLVSCIHKSTSPAVQNAALLLVARLARIAPDVVLHSVMPIFTLMGTSVLRQSDDYSAHVVQQTIREVIPPLVETFRRGKRNVVASAADLLSSFVVAYEHMPSHRRHDMFLALVANLGADDFLFAVVAMFADRYGPTDSTAAFLTELLGTFSAAEQLQALAQLVALVRDVFQAKPALSATLLGKKEGDSNSGSSEVDLQKSALKELALLPALLGRGNRRLREAVSRLDAAADDMEAAKLRELYAQLLEAVLALADTIKASASPARRQPLLNRCGDALAQLLDLQSISEFLKAVETLLDRPSTSVRHKVLRALEVRVDSERAASAAARAALLAFLPQLTAVIRDARDVAYQHTAITCVDKIADKYGRRDLEAVAAAAAAIAGDACLGHPDRRLRIMALLCLASLVDVLQDAIVPVLPAALPRALAYLEASLGGRRGSGSDGNNNNNNTRADPELHNAAYGFVTVLAQHLPYIFKSSDLDRVLASSFASAEVAWEEEDDDDDDDDDEEEEGDNAAAGADGSRTDCLQALARQVDAKVLFDAMRRGWPKAVQAGETATLEFVRILTAAIDKHGKTAIAKSLLTLAALFQNALDLRRELRVGSSSDSSSHVITHIDDVEAAVDAAMLHMVFKLHDAAFRPVFADLMEWCDRGLPQLDVLGRRLRQRSVYGFLHLFFDRLKGAVTPYAAYVVEGAAAALTATRVGASLDDRALWTRVLQTLAACFAHDVSGEEAEGSGSGSGTAGFWQAPAHFSAVAPVLVAQFKKVRDLEKRLGEDDKDEDMDSDNDDDHDDDPIGNALIPAVVQLAKAAHAPAHQKELNTLLLRRLAVAEPAEKLAVVRCQQALADAGGEEWLALLPEMLPHMSELQNDDDERVERETHRWITKIEAVLGENLDTMLQ